MNPKMTFQERAKLGMEALAKQKPVSLEEARAQTSRLQKQSEKSFALAAPKIQEELKKITAPLSFSDTVNICRWLLRKQITIDMIPKDVLKELKETEQYKGTIRRITEIEKRNTTE
jgi:hypothetical protein